MDTIYRSFHQAQRVISTHTRTAMEVGTRSDKEIIYLSFCRAEMRILPSASCASNAVKLLVKMGNWLTGLIEKVCGWYVAPGATWHA